MLNNKINVGFFQFGRIINFDTKKQSITGGSLDEGKVLKILAKRNPYINYHILGSTNLHLCSEEEKLDMFPNNNVYIHIPSTEKDIYTDMLVERLEGIHLDYCIAFCGIHTNVAIPYMIYQKRDPHTYTKPRDDFRLRSSYLIHYLNVSKTPWIYLTKDPRYNFNCAWEIFTNPFVGYSQLNETLILNRVKGYHEESRIHLPKRPYELKYRCLESIFLIDREQKDITKIPKTRNFVMIQNEGGGDGVPSRFPLMKKWILDNPNFRDVEIYGKWKEISTLSDPRFKGGRLIGECQKILSETKYTLCIPIKEKWSTAKIFESAYAGVIPFVIPTYDTQRNSGLPEECRVLSPEDLVNRINYYNNNEEERLNLLRKLQSSLLKPEYFSGDYINNMISESWEIEENKNNIL